MSERFTVSGVSTGRIRARTWSAGAGRHWLRGRWLCERAEIDAVFWFTRRSLPDPVANERPPVIMIHGLVVSGSYFRPVANRLADRFYLLIPDLPGFGQSGRPPETWDVHCLADSLIAWMDAQELRQAVLIANSLGCQVVAGLAVRRPDLVRQLVLIAPTMDPAAPTVRAQMVRGLIDIPREPTSLWQIWIPDLIRAGVWRALRTLQCGLRDDLTARLPQISVPALVVAGERDPICSPGWAATVAARLRHGRLIIVPGAPHALNYSVPRDLARIIEVFIDNPALAIDAPPEERVAGLAAQ